MPREVFGPGFAFLPHAELLRFEEIARVVGAFARAGVHKVRLTGGEPLLASRSGRSGRVDRGGSRHRRHRADHERLAARAPRRAPARPPGSRASRSASTRSTTTTFAQVADTDVTLGSVLEGINAAAAAGFAPIKLNAVIRRNWNEADVEGLASFARDGGHTMRFIEYMDVGDTNGWRLDDVVPAAEIVDRVATRLAARAGAARLPGRGREPLPLPRRLRRSWRHLLDQPAVLRRLHAGPAERDR